MSKLDSAKKGKAPLNSIPALALEAVAGGFEDGNIGRVPFDWREHADRDDEATLYAVLSKYVEATKRHINKLGDPAVCNWDEQTGVHHAISTINNMLIYLDLVGMPYYPSWRVRGEPLVQRFYEKYHDQPIFDKHPNLLVSEVKLFLLIEKDWELSHNALRALNMTWEQDYDGLVAAMLKEIRGL